MYSWAYAWRTQDNIEEGDTDLSYLRTQQAAEFQAALEAHDAEVREQAGAECPNCGPLIPGTPVHGCRNIARGGA